MDERVPALACILGEIDLLRALALEGIRCASVSRPGDPVRYSRFNTVNIDWADPSNDAEELTRRLMLFAEGQPAPPVLFYDGDWDVLLISRLRERLAGAFRFVVPSAELVEDLVDKARFQALAARLALPVPRAEFLAGEVASPATLDLRFPVVVKPLTRDHRTWRCLTSAKAVPFATLAELERFWPLIASAGVEVLVQEEIPGPESAVESYHTYIGDDQQVRAEFTGRKIRTFPASNGYSTALETTDQPELAELGREICHTLSLTGVAKLDFKRAPDGRLYLLEVNPRFSLWHHLGARAGVNIPAQVYRDLTSASPVPARAAVAGVRWCSPIRDARAARLAGIPLSSWFRWAVGCKAKSAFAWNDPMPAVTAQGWRLGRAAASFVRRPRTEGSRKEEPGALRPRR